MIKTSLVMQASHQVAKRIYSSTNDYGIALSFAMKAVWSLAKDLEAHNAKGKNFIEPSVEVYYQHAIKKFRHCFDRPRFVFGIPAWIIFENLHGSDLKNVIRHSTSAKQVRETEKAIKMAFSVEDATKPVVEVWVPKSILAA